MCAVKYRSKSLSSGVGDLSLLLPALTFSLCVSLAANVTVYPPPFDSVTFFFAIACAVAGLERDGFEIILFETTAGVLETVAPGTVSVFFRIICWWWWGCSVGFSS